MASPMGAGNDGPGYHQGIQLARRRTHFKSRFGCTFCKRRRIKCDEVRPNCSHCVRRGLICSLSQAPSPVGPAASSSAGLSTMPMSLPSISSAGHPFSPSSASRPSVPGFGLPGGTPSSLLPLPLPQWGVGAAHHQLPLPQPISPAIPLSSPSPISAGSAYHYAGSVASAASTTTPAPSLPPARTFLPSPSPTIGSATAATTKAPPALPPTLDMVDLELFHHFCTFTATTLGDTKTIQRFWAIEAPRTAFKHPVVLHAILGFAGLDMARLSNSSGSNNSNTAGTAGSTSSGSANTDASTSRAAMLQARVDEHWDRALRIATPLLAEINADNSDALHVYTSLTCLYIFARGPQPGSFLWFDAAEPPDDDETSAPKIRPGSSSGGADAATGAVPGKKTTHSSEEWFVFFRGLRFVNRATQEALRTNFGADAKTAEELSRSLMDQMFGPDADPEGVDDVLRPVRQSTAAASAKGSGGVVPSSLKKEDGKKDISSSSTSGGGGNIGSSADAAAEGGDRIPAVVIGRSEHDEDEDEDDDDDGCRLGGELVDRREPMRDLRDVILQGTRPGDPDRAVYGGALAELAASYVTVFDPDGNPRHRGAVVIFGWMYHVSDEFVALVRVRRPVALAIFAHFAVLLRVLDLVWLVKGWPEHLISGVWHALKPSERLWIHWPMTRIGWMPV